MPEEAGPAHASSWVWSSSSKPEEPAEELGELSWDDASPTEPTVEDVHDSRTSAVENQLRTFSATVGQVQGLEESGDFDLTPLRHLLEQGWADPGTARSKADYQPTSPKSGAWHSQGNQAEVETMEVKAVAPPSPAPPVAVPPPVMALPSEADYPDLVFDQTPSAPPMPMAPPPRKREWNFKPALLAGGAMAALAAIAVPVIVVFLGNKPATTSPPAKAPVASKVDSREVQPAVSPVAVAPVAVAPEPPVKEVSQGKELPKTELDWSGVPAGSKIFWQGQRTETAALGSAAPGKYDLKVIAPGRPTVRLGLQVPEDSDVPLAVGQKVSEALAQQPTLTVALSKSLDKPVQVKVRELGDGATFTTVTKLQGKSSSGIILPKAGKYKVEVAKTETHQAYGQTVTFADGSKKSLQIALKAAPPRVASAPQPSSSYSSSGASYSQPTYHAPSPPRYYGGGGGGGGGGSRIAPPSF